MKRYFHPHRSWLAIHLSDGAVIATESTLGRRKKEIFYDRDIRNVNYWSDKKVSKKKRINKTIGI